MEGRPRVVYVFANPRDRLLDDVAAGRAPDTGLLGLNHLDAFGIDASAHRPRLRRRERAAGLRHRLTWNLRELALPWELGRVDAVLTPLARAYPLAARLTGHVRPLVLNISLCTAYERSTGPNRALIRSTLRAAAGVVCFAEAQRRRLVEQTGLPEERVHSVLLGVDAEFHRAAPLPEDGYVLAVGRDLARDYATLATAAERLDARVVLVASPRNLTGLHLAANVETRTDVSADELRELYEGAAAVAVPTRAEGFPYGADCSGQTVLLDALASARPVVLSRRSTLDDYVRDGETALSVPPEEPDALRAALERVLGDRGLAGRLAAAGRALVEERLTTRHLAGQLAPIVRGAAGR